MPLWQRHGGGAGTSLDTCFGGQLARTCRGRVCHLRQLCQRRIAARLHRMAQIRRGPHVPHLPWRLRQEVIGTARPPTPPRNQGEVACRPNPGLPSGRWENQPGSQADSPAFADADGLHVKLSVYRASVGGFRRGVGGEWLWQNTECYCIKWLRGPASRRVQTRMQG